jgi:C4-dicarboxylate transporter DctM subunit
MKRVLNIVATALDGTSTVFEKIGGFFVVVVACFTFYEIIVRKVFNSPTMWTLEISLYLILTAGFLASAGALKNNRHISVDILTSRLPVQTVSALTNVTNLIGIFLCGFIAYSFLRLTLVSLSLNELSNSPVKTPLFIPKAGIFFGVCLLTLQLLRETIRRWHRGFQEVSGDSSRFITKPSTVVLIFIILITVESYIISTGGSWQVIGVISLLLTILLSGMPVFLSLALLGSVCILFLLGPSGLEHIGLMGYRALSSYSLAAIPLFILGALLISTMGLAEDLSNLCSKYLTFLPGGLGVATIMSCAIFAAITGSSSACAAAIGLVMVPPMVARGYGREFSSGIVAAGGTLGILIPPSIGFIVYGAITEQSIGQLFIAGIIPGIILAGIFACYIMLRCKGDSKYKAPPSSWGERINVTKKALPVLVAPVIVLGGIYTGIFTPNESAAILVIYGIFLFFILTKRKGGVGAQTRHFMTSISDGINYTSMIFMIIVGAIIFGGALTLMRLPQQVTNFATSLDVPPFVIIIMICILLLILGMFLECASITVITIPILFPIIISLGYDPIWFGVLFTINMELALVTPPVGMNLYVLQGISGIKVEEVMKGALPFAFLLMLGIAILMVFPQLATWLPSQMIK